MPDKSLVAAVLAHAKASQHTTNVQGVTEIDGFNFICSDRPTKLEATIYEPVVCLILQGSKETWLGNRCVNFGAGESLIVSHRLPVVSRIVEASPQHPYVALVLRVDMNTIRSLHEELAEAGLQAAPARSLDAGRTDDDLVQAMGRLFHLIGRPLESKVLCPLILREIHFRLLLSAHGTMLRQLVRHESVASRITRTIERIRHEFKTQISIPDLAEIAGMSASTFYQHFKSLTATSPLQYQKDLRLIEARRLLMDATRSISSVAFEVGYESPAQFSREYSRKFGASPRNDLVEYRLIR